MNSAEVTILWCQQVEKQFKFSAPQYVYLKFPKSCSCCSFTPNQMNTHLSFYFFFCLQPCWLNYWLGNIVITRLCDVMLPLVYILSKGFNKIIFSLNTHQAKHSYHCEVAGIEMTLISCTLSKYQLKWYRFLIIDIICTLVSQNLGVLSLKVCTPEPNRNLSC